MLLNQSEIFNYTIYISGKAYRGYIQPEQEKLDCGISNRFIVYRGFPPSPWYLGSINMIWNSDKLQNESQEFSDAIKEFIMLWYQ